MASSESNSNHNITEFSSLILLAKEFRKSPFADPKVVKLKKRRKRDEFLSLADQATAHVDKILKKRKKEYDQSIPKSIKLANAKPPSKTNSLVSFDVRREEPPPFLNELNVFLMGVPDQVSLSSASEDFSKLVIDDEKNREISVVLETQNTPQSEASKSNYIIDLTASIEKVVINEPVMTVPAKDSVLIGTSSFPGIGQNLLPFENILEPSDIVKVSKISNFGKIICRRWKKLKKPCLYNATPSKIDRFLFECPSPDDEILHYLRK